MVRCGRSRLETPMRGRRRCYHLGGESRQSQEEWRAEKRVRKGSVV